MISNELKEIINAGLDRYSSDNSQTINDFLSDYRAIHTVTTKL